jgi:hypothetical protein
MLDYYSQFTFPQWVQNSPMHQIFMQNSMVPNLNEWNFMEWMQLFTELIKVIGAIGMNQKVCIW